MCSISGCLERQQVGQSLRELLPLNFWARIQFPSITGCCILCLATVTRPLMQGRRELETTTEDDGFAVSMRSTLPRRRVGPLNATLGHAAAPDACQRDDSPFVLPSGAHRVRAGLRPWLPLAIVWKPAPDSANRCACLPRWPCNHLSQTQLRACRLCLILSGLFDDSLEFAGQLFVSAGDVRDPARDAACFPVIGTSQGTS